MEPIANPIPVTTTSTTSEALDVVPDLEVASLSKPNTNRCDDSSSTEAAPVIPHTSDLVEPHLQERKYRLQVRFLYIFSRFLRPASRLAKKFKNSRVSLFDEIDEYYLQNPKIRVKIFLADFKSWLAKEFRVKQGF